MREFVRDVWNDPALLRSTNAERPVDWRWQRANHLRDKPTGSMAAEDAVVSQATKYLRTLKANTDTEELARKYPILYECSRIAGSSSLSKWTLEALITGDVPQEEIVNRFGWPKEYGLKVVQLYEALFFDVRDRLGFSAFIIANVLRAVDGPSAKSEDQVMKMLAWTGRKNSLGIGLLDAYLDIDRMPEDVQNWYHSFIDSQLTRRTARSLMRFDPTSNPLAIELIRTYHDSRKLELQLRAQGAELGASDAMDAQKVVLKSLKFTTAEITKIPSSAIEPRASDIMSAEIELLLEQQTTEALRRVPAKEVKNRNIEE